MRRVAALLGLLLLAASTAACGGAGGPDEIAAPSTAAIAESEIETPAPPVGEAVSPAATYNPCDPADTRRACTADVEVGERHEDFLLLTHCFGWAYFAGRYWEAVTSQPSVSTAGVSQPYDSGTMTLTAPDRARYVSEGEDFVAEFRPAPPEFEPGPCA